MPKTQPICSNTCLVNFFHIFSFSPQQGFLINLLLSISFQRGRAQLSKTDPLSYWHVINTNASDLPESPQENCRHWPLVPWRPGCALFSHITTSIKTTVFLRITSNNKYLQFHQENFLPSIPSFFPLFHPFHPSLIPRFSFFSFGSLNLYIYPLNL